MRLRRPTTLAALYRLNGEQALIATTDFFMPIVDDPFDFGAHRRHQRVVGRTPLGGTPIMALAIVGMPINVLPHDVIAENPGRAANRSAPTRAFRRAGHSIDSVEPIYGLAAMGLVHPGASSATPTRCAGDVLILGKLLGVGILSAALKKNLLDAAGYRAMIDTTTLLNRPGSALSALPGVHAITDVTGFGLLGHALEMSARRESHRARAAGRPALAGPGAGLREADGVITGASGRNWASYGASVRLGERRGRHRPCVADRSADLGRPAGGFRAPEDAERVLDIFRGQGFGAPP